MKPGNTATLTPQEKEKLIADAISKVNDFFDGTGEGSIQKMNEIIKKLDSDLGGAKGDLSKVHEHIEQQRAVIDSLTKAIKNSKRGFYVSGIEDQEFSFLRAMVAIRTQDWTRAGLEKEILDQVRQKASQVVGQDSLGGYFVPDQTIADVIAGIYTRSVWVNLTGEGTQRVSLLEGLTGGNVKIPKFDGGVVAYWIGEEDEYAESNTKVGDVTMNPKKLGVLVRITDTMKKLQGYGFEALLRNDMMRAAAKKLDSTIMYGKGGNDTPLGIINSRGIKIYRAETGAILDHDSAAAVSDWDGKALHFDDLDNMQLALEEDDITQDASFAWISSPRAWRYLRQLKVENYTGQTTGLPYLLGMPMLTEGRLAEIIGPYDKSTLIPSNNLPGASIGGATDSTNQKYTDVFGGNLSEVVLGRWAGIEIEDDSGKGKGFTSDHTYMKLRLYADLAIRQNRALICCPDFKVRA